MRIVNEEGGGWQTKWRSQGEEVPERGCVTPKPNGVMVFKEPEQVQTLALSHRLRQ